MAEVRDGGEKFISYYIKISKKPLMKLIILFFCWENGLVGMVFRHRLWTKLNIETTSQIHMLIPSSYLKDLILALLLINDIVEITDYEKLLLFADHL